MVRVDSEVAIAAQEGGTGLLRGSMRLRPDRLQTRLPTRTLQGIPSICTDAYCYDPCQSGSRRLTSNPWQFDDDAQAAVVGGVAGDVLGYDAAAVRFDGTASDRQSETETAGRQST